METVGGEGEGGGDLTLHHSLLENILPTATYRPIVIFCIGLWGWGLNLYLLNKQHVDPAQLLQIHGIEKNTPLHKPIFALATLMTGIILCNVVWYTMTPWHWTPILCYVFALVIIFWPGKNLYRKERERFIRVLRRIFSFNLFSKVYFGDVILADILTSFSNVFGDLFSTCCSATTQDNPCYRDIFVPLLISLPYVIRLRQCLSEYIDSGGECKRHLWNALKYASAFPVIIISASQKKADRYIAATGSVPSTWWISDTGLFRLWMVFVFINSMYSFWWDISVDWNLINISASPRTTMTHHGHQHHLHHYTTPIVRFRRHLHFNESGPYYAAMMIDFILRTTWSLKLSSHLYVKRLEGSIFMMELLEVIRRWVWVIFRMESEWVKRTMGSLPTDNSNLFAMDPLGNNNGGNTATSKLMPIREEDDDETEDPTTK